MKDVIPVQVMPVDAGIRVYTGASEENKALTVEEAASLVRDALSSECSDDTVVLFQQAASGVPDSVARVKEMVASVMRREGLKPEGMDFEEGAEAVYAHLWGLGRLEPFYRDPDVDEICVLPDGKVFVVRRGRHESTGLKLLPAEVERLLDRLVPYDEMGASLNESSPRLESVRPDGVRITALCPPVTKGYCFTLRKHRMMDMTPSKLEEYGTLDQKVWKVLSLLVRGRRNILICGGVGSGKTTLLRLLLRELPAGLSVRILDTDSEIRASELYPERNILEIEEHPEVGASMDKLFQSILRLTPDVIVVGEFRGPREAWEAVQACTRGHMGMATAHFTEPQLAVWGTARLLMKESQNVPFEILLLEAARAFNFIVQVFTDSLKGIKKVISITEVEVEGNSIKYRELVRWEPSTADYLGSGRWVIVNRPSDNSCRLMARYGITEEEIRDVFAI